MVAKTGVEPVWEYIPRDFKSLASTSFTTRPIYPTTQVNNINARKYIIVNHNKIATYLFDFIESLPRKYSRSCFSLQTRVQHALTKHFLHGSGLKINIVYLRSLNSSIIISPFVEGAVGFEPTKTGTKTLCLRPLDNAPNFD